MLNKLFQTAQAWGGVVSSYSDLLETMQKPCWYLALSMAILSTIAVAAVSFWFIALVVKHDGSVTAVNLEDQPCYTKVSGCTILRTGDFGYPCRHAAVTLNTR